MLRWSFHIDPTKYMFWPWWPAGPSSVRFRSFSAEHGPVGFLRMISQQNLLKYIQIWQWYWYVCTVSSVFCVVLFLCRPISVSSYFCVVLFLCRPISVLSYFCVVLFLCRSISVSSYFCVILFLCCPISVSSYFCVVLFLCRPISVSSYFCVVLFLHASCVLSFLQVSRPIISGSTVRRSSSPVSVTWSR